MSKKKDSEKIREEINDGTTQVIFSVCSFLLVILAMLAAFGKAGRIGDGAFKILYRLFGIGYYLVPMMFAMLGITFLQGLKKRFEITKGIGALLFLISGLGLIHMAYAGAGGIIGRFIASPLINLLDVYATTAILIAVFAISIIMTFNLYFTWTDITFWRRGLIAQKSEKMDEYEEAAVNKAVADMENKNLTAKGQGIDDSMLATKNQQLKTKGGFFDFTDDEEFGFATSAAVPHLLPYMPPPLSLLEKDRGKPETGDIKANANIIKRTLKNFGITVEMDEISIGPSVTRYALKPAEGVKLSRIVALNNDLSLALAAHPIRIEAPIPGKSLVGIEVPNTAKTTVGLATILSSPDFQESEKPLLVSLGKDITGRAHFSDLGKAPHMLIAGATGSGKSVAIHALITSLLYRNSPENLKFIMIDPKRVELTMYNKIPHLPTPVITDPKKAIFALRWAAKEMSRRYDTLEKNAARDVDSYHKSILWPALEKYKKTNKVATAGSETRGNLVSRPAIARAGENKGGHGDNSNTGVLPETMPFIVIIIDELADIMQAYPRELESAIVRLAQMSRAVGIHLVISTQRPSVDVITGLIKVNIPSRIALQVSSQIDSRTILDQMGAEKLLGSGDMLYLGSEMSKPVRLQSAYISESEVKRVVKYLADEYRDEIMSEIDLTPIEAGSSAAFDSITKNDLLEEEDELYEIARETVTSVGKASTSYLQRKLGVGYSRAAKLMDMLEEHGVIGPANGSKPREIIGVGVGIEQQSPIIPEQSELTI